MLGNQQCKVGVFGLQCGVLIAVAVNGNNSVCVFINNGTLGIHTKGSYFITILLGAVNNFAFIKLIGNVGKYLSRQLHTDTDIYTAGFGGDVQLLADLFHPFASASAYGNDTFFTGMLFFTAFYAVAAVDNVNPVHGRIKEEFNAVLEISVKIFENYIVYIRTEMAHGNVEQMEVVLYAFLFEFSLLKLKTFFIIVQPI